jgi:hypothetical protein
MMNSTDGWDDDDVDLEDDEDIFMEDNDSNIPTDQGTTTDLPGVTMGPGLFVGRFTQMISQVVAPQNTISASIGSTREADAKEHGTTTPSQTTNGTLYSLLPVPTTTTSIEDEGGWDDDLDAIDVDDDDDQGGWSHNDDDLDDL